MSSLSDLFPAGAGKEVSFTASGTIASGKTVILNANGTVTAVSGQNFASGSEAVFDGDDPPNDGVSVFDSTSNKVVIVYRDGNDGWAVVGTVSGSSISFGTPVAWHSLSYAATELAVAYDSNADRVVIAYKENYASDYGYTIVGTVSGTSISFGTKVVYNSATSRYPVLVFDSDNNKVVVYYNGVVAKVGTVSGTSISFGSAVDISGGSGGEAVNAVFDTNANKHVATFRNYAGGGTTADSAVGTVSGTSISFGSSSQFATNAGSSLGRPMAFDSTNNKVVVFFNDANNSNTLTAVVGTVSGTSVSYGTPVATSKVELGSQDLRPGQAVFDSNAGVVALVFSSSNETFLLVGKVSGTTITLDPLITLNGGGRADYPNMTYDSNAQKVVVSYADNTTGNDGTSVVITVPASNVTASNFLGISGGAISDGSSGSITIKGGVSSNVSGLTANSVYYVAKDGTLTTTSSSNVLAGRAISSTSIDLDYST